MLIISARNKQRTLKNIVILHKPQIELVSVIQYNLFNYCNGAFIVAVKTCEDLQHMKVTFVLKGIFIIGKIHSHSTVSVLSKCHTKCKR